MKATREILIIFSANLLGNYIYQTTSLGRLSSLGTHVFISRKLYFLLGWVLLFCELLWSCLHVHTHLYLSSMQLETYAIHKKKEKMLVAGQNVTHHAYSYVGNNVIT